MPRPSAITKCWPGAITRLDYRVITADGRCLWVRDIVSLIEHGHEPVMRGRSTITDAKRTEEALRLFGTEVRRCSAMPGHSGDRPPDRRPPAGGQRSVRRTDRPKGRGRRSAGRHRPEHLGHSPASGQGCCSACRPAVSATWRCPFVPQPTARCSPGLISAEPFDLDITPALVVVVRDITQLKETNNNCKPPKKSSPRPSMPLPTACCCRARVTACCWRSTRGSVASPASTAPCRWIVLVLDLGIWVNLNERKQKC